MAAAAQDLDQSIGDEENPSIHVNQLIALPKAEVQEAYFIFFFFH